VVSFRDWAAGHRAIQLDAGRSGETVLYTPAGAAQRAIVGDLRVEQDLDPVKQRDGRMRIQHATLVISTDASDGIAAPTQQDRVVARGVTWSVVERVGTDDLTKTQTLQLRTYVPTEKSAADYRIER
jgi:hypothetical protein